MLSLAEQTKEIFHVNEYWRYIIQGVARGCYSFQFAVLLNWVECKKQNCGILFTSLLHDVYVWLNTFRAPPRPSSGAYTALGASGFTVGEWRLERCWSWSGRPRPTVKPEALVAFVELLMMGGKVPETC